MNAAFMSFQPRESGIHAVRSGAGEASVTEVRFWCAPQAGGEARTDHDQLKLSSIALERHGCHIRALRRGKGGARVAGVRSRACVLSYRNDELTGASQRRWS